MRGCRIAVGPIAAVLWLPLAAFGAAPQDFSGEWVVVGKNQNAQDGASSAPATGSHHGGHGGGMGGGMGGSGHGMGGGGHGGGGRHHGDSSADSGARAGAQGSVGNDPRVAAQALTIRQSEVVFDVAADGGKRMVYRFDNRNNYGPDYGGTVTLTWSAPDMIIETHPDAGGSVEERYTLSEDGKQLTQHVHEQRAGTDTSRDFTRMFVRSGTQAAQGSQTLP